MKKLKYIFLVLLIGTIQSCDWLDLKPIDSYGNGNFWTSKDQVDRYIRGIHSKFRINQETFFKMGEVRGGTLVGESASLFGQNIADVPVVNNNLSATNPGISGWGAFYDVILQINHAITEVPKTTFLTDAEKNNTMGILHGMRAYYYFHLFRTYGGVPLIKTARVMESAFTPEDLNTPRSTEEETYNFLVEDVKASDDYFATDAYTVNTTDKSSYWSKAATKVLRAEILLWGCKVKPIGGSSVFSKNVSEDLRVAKAALQDLMDSGKYGYVKDAKFSDVFDVTKKDNKEIIFAIRYVLGEATNFFNTFLYPSNVNLTGFKDSNGVEYTTSTNDPLKLASAGTASGHQYREDFFKTFSKDDTRRSATFFDVYRVSDDAAAILTVKFMGELDLSKIVRFTNDWPIYRYSDVLLTMAEIVALQGGDPSTYINAVRERAYGSKYNDYKYPHNDETAEQAILEERSKEFVAEGKRWYDMRRMMNGQGAKDLQVNVTGALVEQHLLWPIDAAVMTKDPLVEQTLGY